jgi:uncharacterized protein (TIGR00369 family)
MKKPIIQVCFNLLNLRNLRIKIDLSSYKKPMKDLRDNQLCYVCGSKNETGLRVAFEIDSDAKSIKGRFTPAAGHQGYEGIVHGGIISALLDEAMAKLAFSLGLPAVTAEMTVKFRSPAAPGEELLVTGRLLDIDRRLVLGEAKVEQGLIVIAEATGKLVKVS